MKVQVNALLNARREPNTSHTPQAVRNSGYILDVDDICVTGTCINGNSIWYHNSTDGCWYWSGGTAFTNDLLIGKVFTAAEQSIIYRCAVNELSQQYSSLQGFKGLAAGLKTSGGTIVFNRPALIFYVKNKLNAGDETIPSTINYRGIGLVTDVYSLAGIQFSTDPNADIVADRNPLYPMGGSISEQTPGNTSFGSRSAKVIRDGKEYLLTCFHVACNSLYQQKIMTTSGGVVKNQYPSPLFIKNTTQVPASVFEGNLSPTFDYALLETDTSFLAGGSMPNFQFTGFYNEDEIVSNSLAGIQVSSYGAATQGSSSPGTLLTYWSEGTDVDDSLGFKISGLLQATKISDKGDSGAPVVANNKLVGYIIADNPYYSFIMPYANLIKYNIISNIKL